MTGETFRVLLVEDEALYARALARALEAEGMACAVAGSGADALRLCDEGDRDLVLLDQRLPDAFGIDLIPRILGRLPRAAIVLLTAHHTIPDAVRAIRLGAEDYLVKETSIAPVLARARQARERLRLRRRAGDRREHQRGGPLGNSPAMKRMVADLEKLARSPDTTVLITGETGVGKEVAARHLHRISRPEGSPMLTVDCVSLPDGLAESILFGHEKGAFTGADRARTGAFEEARDGTIFLDEVGDMGTVQVKLLRVLEGRRFARVGSHREIPLRARVVAATHRDLRAMAAAGTFREDLYQRLSVFPIHIPPLRQRGDDVLLLAEHFRAFFAAQLGREVEPLGEDVQAVLLGYDFPGNVRELKNIIERAVIVSDSGRIEVSHLPERVLRRRPAPATSAPAIPVDFMPGVDTLEGLEQRMIRQALRRSGGVKAEAARLLGISRYQLLRRMEKYGIRGGDGGGGDGAGKAR